MKYLTFLYMAGLSIIVVSWTYGFLRFNVFLISVMGIISVVQFFRLTSFLKYPSLVVFYCLNMLVPLLHSESYRISTVLYTGMFCCSYVFFMEMLHKKVITADNLLLFLKYLIYAYFIVLVMQQIGILTGTWIINKGGFSSLSITKLNSLSTEPALSCRILFLALNSFLTIKSIKSGKPYSFASLSKNDTKLFFSYSYCMLTMGSTTGLILYATSFLIHNKLTFKQLMANTIPLFVVIGFIVFGNLSLLDRTRTFFNVFIFFDPEYLRLIDASAAARIAPVLIYFQNLDLFSQSFWLGAGIDQSQIINREFFNYDIDSESVIGGMIPNYLIDFGVIPFIFFSVMIYKYCLRKQNMEMLLWDIFLFLSVCIPQPLNTPGLWWGIVMFSANCFFIIQNNNSTEEKTTPGNHPLQPLQPATAGPPGCYHDEE